MVQSRKNHKDRSKFHVILKFECSIALMCSQHVQEMERSADVLSAGLLEVANPSLSSRFFLKQVNMFCLIYPAS